MTTPPTQTLTTNSVPAPTVLLDAISYAWPGASHPVLQDFSLRLDPGERVFVRGGSGTGKTTLISLIGGLLRPDAGRISLLGQDLGSLSAGARDHFRADHIGFVFQMFNLVPYLSLVDNVLLSCRFSKRRRARALAAGTGSGRGALVQEAERLLERLHLPAAVRARRQVTALSVGQQQRVAVARALIGRPELIIADEPTSALDASARAGFIELLFEECTAAGTSLLFVSHDEALAPLFPRTLVLDPLGGDSTC